VETLEGFPLLPAVVRGRQSRPAPHAIHSRWAKRSAAVHTAQPEKKTMRRFPPAINLTALLALAALADLVLYRVVDAIFLPGQNGTPSEHWLSLFCVFVSNLAGILALLVAVVALVQALRSDQVFPRAMRITVATIGLFCFVLAGFGLLWLPAAARYQVHLRISHGFLVFFLALGVWHGGRPWRFKLGITLFALPIAIQAAALFLHRMTWSPVDPARLMHVAHTLALTAMTMAPVFLAPWPGKKNRVANGLVAGLLFATALSAAVVLRFDLTQAVFAYGLRMDLTGFATSAERFSAGAIVVAYSCLFAATVTCLLQPGRSRLAGWGLLLIAVAGMDIVSPSSALFALCGLLALAVASAQSQDAPSAVPRTSQQ
jgi:hypothetical protein